MPRADKLHRPIGPSELDEVTEKRRVAENQGRGLIVPYVRHDPHAEPVILVHGINAAPQDLRKIADHLARNPRFQVYIYLYEDRRRYLDHVAMDLAHDLGILHDPGQPVRIVAHSMGGIVARAALNSLIDPRWLARAAPDLRDVADPHEIDVDLPNIKDFPSVEVITVDTPWRGFKGPRVNFRNFFVGERSFVDMIANSDVFKNLHRVDLPGNVRIHHVEADNAAAGVKEDRIVGLCELSDRDIDRLIDHFSDRARALDGDTMLKNQLLALEEEADYPAVLAAIRLDVQRGRLDRARLREHLRELVPALPGSHVSVLDQGELLRLLDRTFGGVESA
ncbi:MAG: hypothetical protein R3B09_12360 [Nannocystaceae bacterium]